MPHPKFGDNKKFRYRPTPGLMCLAIALALYVSLAIIIAPGNFLIFTELYAKRMMRHGLQPLLVIAPLYLAFMMLRRGDSIWRTEVRRIGQVLAITLPGLLLMFSAFTTLKFNIPEVIPFYADLWAANLDAALHGGDAWRWTHAIWPENWGYAMSFAYSKIWFLYWLGTPFVAVILFRQDLMEHYLWAMFLTVVICGSLLATLLSSVGPVFYDDFFGGTRYQPLIHRLEAVSGMDRVLIYANYLYESNETRSIAFGTGISAIPSVHVASVTLNALFYSRVNKVAGTLAWMYASLILFGSVYTGWHYAIDGYISIIVVSGIWFGVGALIKRGTTPIWAPKRAFNAA